LSSPMDKRELQMLEMMRNILGVDSPDLASGRAQRPLPMLFANSVPCEDSLPEDTNDSFNFFDEDLDDSVECNDFGQPCDHPKPPLEPCPNPLVPMDHPCFVRVIVLRTPLMRHDDPCTNFTLALQAAGSTSTTAKPKGRKCKPRVKKVKPKPQLRLANSTSSTTTSSTVSAGTTTTELPAATTSTTEPETSTTTTEEPTTTTTEQSTTTTTEQPTTTTTTTTEMTTTTSESSSTSASVVYTRNNQLKSLRGRRRKQGRRRPSVPDTPRIKLDGAMQSSDALPVFQSTEVGELRSRSTSSTMRPETTTKPDDLETTTPECVEDTNDMEAESQQEAEGSETEGSEDCEDAEDQDTNLCPQFSAPEGPANMRLLPASRYRKPVKNYVEPILYEGQGFAKPRQRVGMLQPQRRDYYVSNKQIMPRPRPKYREPVPHSIYMNNIVRGVKCSDEVPGHHNSHASHPQPHPHPHPHPHPVQPRRYRNGKPIGPTQRGWMGRRHGPGYAAPGGSQPITTGHDRQRSNPLYGLNSAEDLDAFGHDSEYYDDVSGERLNWPREAHAPGSLSPTVDPCQAEHRQDRERERARERERQQEQDRERENDQVDYPQVVAPRYFT
ncbi:hypothetical protein KR044_005306, partial [Drosophila immigrans]